MVSTRSLNRLTGDVRPISDLNTTPLIDVMLVMLIMFILTIPPQSHKVALSLPAPSPHPDPIDIRPVRNVITIEGRGTITWNGHAVDRVGLRRLLAASLRMPVEPALDLKPGAEARYETVDAVLVDIKRSGVTKLGLPGNEAYRAF